MLVVLKCFDLNSILNAYSTKICNPMANIGLWATTIDLYVDVGWLHSLALHTPI